MPHHWKNEQDRKEFFAKLRMGETNMPIDRRTPREIAESMVYYDGEPLPFDDIKSFGETAETLASLFQVFAEGLQSTDGKKRGNGERKP